MQPCLITVPISPIDVVVGCSSNDECPNYAACLNGACRNPCAYDDPCAQNAFCKVIFHSAKCACPNGYIGDPHIECKLPPRKIDIVVRQGVSSSTPSSLAKGEICRLEWSNRPWQWTSALDEEIQNSIHLHKADIS